MPQAGSVVEEEEEDWMQIFSSAAVEPTNISQASIKQVLGLVHTIELF
jgi:hypothetical protein